MTHSMYTQRPLPGPIAERIYQKRHQAVPRGVGSSIPTFVAQAVGATITDVDGHTWIDFAGGIGTQNTGHCPPQVVERLKKQLDAYIHPGFPVMMYEPYIELADKLNQITPGNHPKKTFFLNSGAEAVENAIKIARKYTKRKAVISFERGFHGRTLLTMSLTGKVKPYKYEFGPFAPEVYKMPYPYYYRAPETMDPDQLDALLLSQIETFFLQEVPAEEVAAIIMEPVQGEGGFIVPSKGFVQGIKAICERYGILFIADEIQTGFGRTGTRFAMEHFDVVPDLITLSKSIAAGIPISAVTGRAEVMDAPAPGEIGGTFGGSPLGCVAALEVIQLMDDRLLQRAQQIGKKIMQQFSRWQDEFSFIGEVRGLGAMCALEVVKDRENKTPDKELTQAIVQACASKGLILLSAGLYGNVIRILVPLVINDEQLSAGLSILHRVLEEVGQNESEHGVRR